MSNENASEGSLEKAIVASMIRRANAMKILLFLSNDVDNLEAYYLQEISNILDMSEATAFTNLKKLLIAGLVEKTEAKGNKKSKYYSISNKKLAEKAIEKYKHAVGFQLARLVPYQRLYASQLKREKRFIDACVEYGLNLSEGINAVLNCYKIGKEHTRTDTILLRNAQGFDPEEQTENEKVEAEEIE